MNSTAVHEFLVRVHDPDATIDHLEWVLSLYHGELDAPPLIEITEVFEPNDRNRR